MNNAYRNILTVVGLALLSVAVLLPAVSRACTTASTPNIANVGPMIVKSYDWDNRDGLVFLNTGHIKKTAVGVPNPKVWTSKYFNVTFNQWGLNMPMGGMNTQGLVVEVLKVGDFTKDREKQDYPNTSKAAQGSHAINQLSWVQYILDTSKNLNEAVSHAKAVYIDPNFSALGGIQKFGIDTVHYNVCDVKGRCRTFEYRDKHKDIIISKIHSWDGLPEKKFPKGVLPFGQDSVGPKGAQVNRPLVPVLANNFYDTDSACLEAWATVPVGTKCSADTACYDACFTSDEKKDKKKNFSKYDSTYRFIKAASFAKATSNLSSVQQAVNYGFNQIAKSVCNKDTRWQIVYLPKLKKVYWRTINKCKPAHKKPYGYVNISKGHHHHSCRDKKHVKVYDLDGSVAGHPYEAISYDESLFSKAKFKSLNDINGRSLYKNFRHSRFKTTENGDYHKAGYMSGIQNSALYQSCQF